jgi:hypothetical protein
MSRNVAATICFADFFLVTARATAGAMESRKPSTTIDGISRSPDSPPLWGGTI